MNVQGLTAIITGGGTGMGAAAAKLLSERGAKAVLLGRRKEQIDRTAAAIGAIALQCDIANEHSVDAAFDEVQEKVGSARILVNCAALGGMMPLLRANGEILSREKIREIIDVNVLGTLFTNQVFAQRLSSVDPVADGVRGVIVNVSSIGGLDGVVGSTYAASKAAVNGLCLSLAREFSPLAIRVMTIAPGSIDTPMFREGANKNTYDIVAASVLGVTRIGTPEEFGKLVLHTIENDYLNGSIIRLDGGMRVPNVPNTSVTSEDLA